MTGNPCGDSVPHMRAYCTVTNVVKNYSALSGRWLLIDDAVSDDVEYPELVSWTCDLVMLECEPSC